MIWTALILAVAAPSFDDDYQGCMVDYRYNACDRAIAATLSGLVQQALSRNGTVTMKQDARLVALSMRRNRLDPGTAPEIMRQPFFRERTRPWWAEPAPSSALDERFADAVASTHTDGEQLWVVDLNDSGVRWTHHTGHPDHTIKGEMCGARFEGDKVWLLRRNGNGRCVGPHLLDLQTGQRRSYLRKPATSEMLGLHKDDPPVRLVSDWLQNRTAPEPTRTICGTVVRTSSRGWHGTSLRDMKVSFVDTPIHGADVYVFDAEHPAVGTPKRPGHPAQVPALHTANMGQARSDAEGSFCVSGVRAHRDLLIKGWSPLGELHGRVPGSADDATIKLTTYGEPDTPVFIDPQGPDSGPIPTRLYEVVDAQGEPIGGAHVVMGTWVVQTGPEGTAWGPDQPVWAFAEGLRSPAPSLVQTTSRLVLSEPLTTMCRVTFSDGQPHPGAPEPFPCHDPPDTLAPSDFHRASWHDEPDYVHVEVRNHTRITLPNGEGFHHVVGSTHDTVELELGRHTIQAVLALGPDIPRDAFIQEGWIDVEPGSTTAELSPTYRGRFPGSNWTMVDVAGVPVPHAPVKVWMDAFSRFVESTSDAEGLVYIPHARDAPKVLWNDMPVVLENGTIRTEHSTPATTPRPLGPGDSWNLTSPYLGKRSDYTYVVSIGNDRMAIVPWDEGRPLMLDREQTP